MNVLAIPLLLAVFISQASIAGVPDEADAEIQQLLKFVATSGCTFERNGSSHSPEDAADHLKLKYRRGGRYVSTAEQFIDRLASESSWTGRKYSVNCQGEERPSGEWLHEALDNLRSSPATEANTAQ